MGTSGRDGLLAARREHDAVLAYFGDLTDAEWETPSRADGWTVKDVLAHMAALSRGLFTPDAVKLIRSADIEAVNEVPVARSREWSGARVLAEYRRWGSRQLRLARAVVPTPLARLKVPLVQFGPLPAAQLLNSSMVFDHHVHLRHDVAPVLSRPVPATDELRLGVAVDWMFALLAGQFTKEPEALPPESVAFALTGAGGGRWTLTPRGSVESGEQPCSATIFGSAEDFPLWGTTRTCWRDAGLTITGDRGLAEALLDRLNIV